MKDLVSRLEVEQVVCQRLAETPGIKIKELDKKKHRYILISQEDRKDQRNFVAKETCIYLHDRLMPVEDFDEFAKSNSESGIYTGHIFIDRPGEFIKRLGHTAQIKESLSKYSFEDKKNIVKPREVVKHALDQLDSDVESPRRILTFCDPESKILIGRHFGPVDLDYSYLPRDHSAYGHAKSGISKDFMLMKDKFKIKGGGLASVVYNSQLLIATIIPPGSIAKRYRK